VAFGLPPKADPGRVVALANVRCGPIGDMPSISHSTGHAFGLFGHFAPVTPQVEIIDLALRPGLSSGLPVVFRGDRSIFDQINKRSRNP
jgi:hypothetical protein